MTINTSDVAVTAPDIYSLPFYRELLYLIDILKPIWPSLVLAGLISNTINVATFLKSGVKDSVTTLLLTLSVSDALFLTLIIPTVIFYQVKATPTTRILHYVCYWPATTIYDYSSYISLFLAVTRSACVVKPLHFKSVFTRTKTIIAVVLLLCIDVLLHIPVLTLHNLQWRTDPWTNRTSLELVRDIAKIGPKIRINDALNKNAIAGTTFVLMIVCTSLLSFKLFESSKFRSLPASDPDSGKSSQTQKQKLSPKDARVVKSVVLVCTIFIVAQIPAFCHSVARVLIADSVENRWVARFLTRIILTSYMTNASINIFVYYNCNSKYRAVLRSFLRIKDKK